MLDCFVVLLGVSSVMTALGTIAMLLRFYVSLAGIRKAGLDDLMFFLSWACAIAMSATIWVLVGRLPAKGEVSESLIRWISATSAISKTAELTYYWSFYFVKMSVLFLYLRFGSALRNWFWMGTIVMMFVFTAQIIAIQVAFFFQCTTAATDGKNCIDISAYLISISYFSIITDIIIIALPLPIFWRLRRPLHDRILVSGSILIGLLSTAATCGRLVTLESFIKHIDPSHAAYISALSFVELYLGLVCVSGPVFKCALSHWLRGRRKAAQRDAQDVSAGRLVEKRGAKPGWECTQQSNMSSDMSSDGNAGETKEPFALSLVLPNTTTPGERRRSSIERGFVITAMTDEDRQREKDGKTKDLSLWWTGSRPREKESDCER